MSQQSGNGFNICIAHLQIYLSHTVYHPADDQTAHQDYLVSDRYPFVLIETGTAPLH